MKERNTIDEQYYIQYKEIKSRWKKIRMKSALKYFIIGVIMAVTTLIVKDMTGLMIWAKYITGLITIICATCTLREITQPTNQEIIELKQLDKIYNWERFKERKG